MKFQIEIDCNKELIQALLINDIYGSFIDTEIQYQAYCKAPYTKFVEYLTDRVISNGHPGFKALRMTAIMPFESDDEYNLFEEILEHILNKDDTPIITIDVGVSSAPVSVVPNDEVKELKVYAPRIHEETLDRKIHKLRLEIKKYEYRRDVTANIKSFVVENYGESEITDKHSQKINEMQTELYRLLIEKQELSECTEDD